ncbi:capsid protein [Chestnut teal chaphamaparvovirus 3]|uniref:Capsid protein n=1 Tax=Chestnut teal chaphamaparvovirus 3 TaxID=2759405 RepID=A0A7D7AHZ9_9VIRU|nr:capsid protein [Chestnut teal chaphamaparvovirus 3]QMI57839.1 capsid protein [Chestnut teal chaphamaparvovirus 3]
MEDFDITNVYMAYVENQPYIYPSIDEHTIREADKFLRSVPTGWQIVPNILWRHFCKPKQWAELNINYEAYAVKGIKCTIFNPIPITNNLAIQRTSLFAAFNNCTYCNTYQDELYETSWHPWYVRTGAQVDNLNLMYKEGVFYTGYSHATDGGEGGSSTHRGYIYKFPQYYWDRQYVTNEFPDVWSQGKTGSAGVFDTFDASHPDSQPIPAAVLWDPFERPDHIGELRAGKNATTFTWEVAPCDNNKVFNLDRIAQYASWTTAGPYIGATSARPGTGKKYSDMDPEVVTTYGMHARNTQTTNNGVAFDASIRQGYFEDYTVPNWAHIPIVPNAWFWQEIQKSIADVKMDKAWQKIDKYWAGTETEQFKYPPCQFFCKGVPLYDANTSHIHTLTQVSVKMTLMLSCKKRRSAYFCPTWGPFSGEQIYYHNPHKLIYQEGMIRYRTGGMRRTWQNLNRFSTDPTRKVYGREDCYAIPANPNEITAGWYTAPSIPVPTDVGQQGLRAGENAEEGNNRKPEIEITVEKGGKSIVRYRPQAPARKKTPSPEKYADMQLMEHMDTHI